MHFRPSSGGKHIFGVFRAHRTCLVAANEGINSALPNPLAGFEANFAAKEGKKKKWKDGKRKGRKDTEETEESLTLSPNKFLVTALCRIVHIGRCGRCSNNPDRDLDRHLRHQKRDQNHSDITSRREVFDFDVMRHVNLAFICRYPHPSSSCPSLL